MRPVTRAGRWGRGVGELLGGRYPDREGGTRPKRARDLHLAAVALGHVAHDAQAETGPPGLPRAPLVHPVEALEDAPLVG